MYACMHVCVCMYVRVYVCLCMFLYVLSIMRVCMYVCMHACMHAILYLWGCTCAYVCTHAHIYIRVFLLIRSQLLLVTYTCTCRYIRICIGVCTFDMCREKHGNGDRHLALFCMFKAAEPEADVGVVVAVVLSEASATNEGARSL